MPYVNKKEANQAAHLLSLINIFVVHCLDGLVPIIAKSKISRLWLASVVEHAGLESYLVATPKDRFSCDRTQFLLFQKSIKEFFHPLVIAKIQIPRNAKKKPLGKIIF